MRPYAFFTGIVLCAWLAACSTSSLRREPAEPSIVIDDAAIDAPLLLAQQAYSDGDHVFIQFRSPTDTINSYAPLSTHSATGSQGLQQIVKRYRDPPFTRLSYLDPEQWMIRTHELEDLPIAGVALWREFRDRMLGSVTPRKPGQGIAVEFLKREELFFFYDQHGLLQSLPLHDKPPELRTVKTYRFREMLRDAAPLLGEYIVASGRDDASALVFNTGDDATYGYPFIYADLEGRAVFLQRLPENLECCAPDNMLVPDTIAHTTRSHLGCMITQPIGSVARLFSLVTFKLVDTVTPHSVAFLQGTPVPPVADRPPMDTEEWERELDELVYSPLTQGSIEYLVDGAAFFSRLIDAIQSARSSIDIQLYIFDNDDYALKIADLLKRRSKDVRVRILVDGLGTISATSTHSPTMPEDFEPPRIIQYLQTDSKIRIRTMLNPWMTGDHTKTILVDGHTAFIGGMNIGREYRYDWHDLMIELRGPIVDEIQTNFEKTWRRESFLGEFRAMLYRHKTRNKPADQDIPIRLLFTRPGDSQILRAQLAAIARARQRIYIENAYFTSDAVIYELAKARRRGVDVRVIIPYASDYGIIDRSNVLAINNMLANGIRVYVYPGESHIKGAVYDNWICLGSANFDALSLRMNKELNIATSDPAAVQAFMDNVLAPDFDKSVELEQPLPEKWSDVLLEMLADHL